MADDLESIELFISHASEDKEELVRPLADYLRRVGVKVWYDEFTLTAGDSLSRSIDKGLATARYGLVVISPHFIRKRWPEYELRGLTAKEISSEGKVIVPIWHKISRDDLLSFSPSLVDKVAVVTEGLRLPEIAEGVLRAIRPDLAQRVSMLRALLRSRATDTPMSAPLDQVAAMPMPKEILAEGHVVVRTLLIVNTLGMASPKLVGSFKTFITDLYRDIHPELELRVWETMAAAYLNVAKHFELSSEERAEIVNLLLACSLGDSRGVSESGTRLSSEIAHLAIKSWKQFAEISNQEKIRFTTEDAEEAVSE